MPNRRKDIMDIRALLRHLRAGEKDRSIARALGMARPTVKRYRAWAQHHGLLEGALPSLEALQLLRRIARKCAPVNAGPTPRPRPVDPGRIFADPLKGSNSLRLCQESCGNAHW